MPNKTEGAAMTLIENCDLRFEFVCPKQWSDLSTTEDDRVRYCEACRERVYLCATASEAAEHSRSRRCIALLNPAPQTETGSANPSDEGTELLSRVQEMRDQLATMTLGMPSTERLEEMLRALRPDGKDPRRPFDGMESGSQTGRD
jgi:hypothetical protein